MNNLVAQRQGQPVLFLCLLVAGWLLLRVLTWNSPWHERAILSEPFLLVGETVSAPYSDTAQAAAPDTRLLPAATGRREHANVLSLDRAYRRRTEGSGWSEDDAIRSLLGRAAANGGVLPREPFTTPSKLAGAPGLGSANGANTGEGATPPTIQGPKTSNWRIDAWLVLREGFSRPADGGLLPASYGGSQIGAVMSYRLSPISARQPAAYFRATRSIGADDQTDTALGLRVRAMQGVPIYLHAEARVTHRPGSTEIRPAAFAAGGFDQLVLPMDFAARGYGQAGYVGGDFATPFADGTMVAERKAVRSGSASVSIGGGMWGGAQEDASRFDVGPTVTIEMVAGKVPIRLETGYRVRVAGNAAPGNGGVLTLSTGF